MWMTFRPDYKNKGGVIRQPTERELNVSSWNVSTNKRLQLREKRLTDKEGPTRIIDDSEVNNVIRIASKVAQMTAVTSVTND